MPCLWFYLQPSRKPKYTEIYSESFWTQVGISKSLITFSSMLFPSYNLSSSKQTERIQARRCIFTDSGEHCLHVENCSLFNILQRGYWIHLIHTTVGHISKYIKTVELLYKLVVSFLFVHFIFSSVGMGTKSNFSSCFCSESNYSPCMSSSIFRWSHKPGTLASHKHRTNRLHLS